MWLLLSDSFSPELSAFFEHILCFLKHLLVVLCEPTNSKAVVKELLPEVRQEACVPLPLLTTLKPCQLFD